MLIFHRGWSEGFDGPGTRLIYYLKGCNLHCDWCGSPESISPRPELLYHPERDNMPKCCPYGAPGPEKTLNRELCRKCESRDCVRVWRNPAFELAGSEITPEEVLQEARQARNLISGVTFGGGEPTLQMDDLLTCLDLLRNDGFHTAAESNAATAEFARLPGRVDLLFADLKTLNPELAARRVGVSLPLLRENLRLAAKDQPELRIRIPVVTGLNDTPERQRELADFCRELKELRPDRTLSVELLRQHHLADPKYRALSRANPTESVEPPSRETMQEFARVLNKDCTVTIFQ